LTKVVLNKAASLKFDDCEFNKNQADTIDELKLLVIQRANELLDQLEQFDIVAQEVF